VVAAAEKSLLVHDVMAAVGRLDLANIPVLTILFGIFWL
jgi:hypothetical protein